MGSRYLFICLYLCWKSTSAGRLPQETLNQIHSKPPLTAPDNYFNQASIISCPFTKLLSKRQNVISLCENCLKTLILAAGPLTLHGILTKLRHCARCAKQVPVNS